MKIEEGKFYKRRDGEVVGPLGRATVHSHLLFYPNSCGQQWWLSGKPYGAPEGQDDPRDLIEEVPAPTPVRTVTRKEIVPGRFGRGDGMEVETGRDPSLTFVGIDADWYRAESIREFARLLNEIADAMEDQP